MNDPICVRCGWPVYVNSDGLRCCRNLACPKWQRTVVREQAASAALPWVVAMAAVGGFILILI